MIELNEQEEAMIGRIDEKTAYFYKRHKYGILDMLEEIESINRTKIYLAITNYSAFLLEHSDVEILTDIYDRHFKENYWQLVVFDI